MVINVTCNYGSTIPTSTTRHHNLTSPPPPGTATTIRLPSGAVTRHHHLVTIITLPLPTHEPLQIPTKSLYQNHHQSRYMTSVVMCWVFIACIVSWRDTFCCGFRAMCVFNLFFHAFQRFQVFHIHTITVWILTQSKSKSYSLLKRTFQFSTILFTRL